MTAKLGFLRTWLIHVNELMYSLSGKAALINVIVILNRGITKSKNRVIPLQKSLNIRKYLFLNLSNQMNIIH